MHQLLQKSLLQLDAPAATKISPAAGCTSCYKNLSCSWMHQLLQKSLLQLDATAASKISPAAGCEFMLVCMHKYTMEEPRFRSQFDLLFHSIRSSNTLSLGFREPNCVIGFSADRVWLVTRFYIFIFLR